MSDLTTLQGIGPKVADWLTQANITNAAELRTLGAVEAYLHILGKNGFPCQHFITLLS